MRLGNYSVEGAIIRCVLANAWLPRWYQSYPSHIDQAVETLNRPRGQNEGLCREAERISPETTSTAIVWCRPGCRYG